jgi:hypothetical protein
MYFFSFSLFLSISLEVRKIVTLTTTIEYTTESSALLPTVSFCTEKPGFKRDQPIESFLIYCSVDNNLDCLSEPNEWFEQYEV